MTPESMTAVQRAEQAEARIRELEEELVGYEVFQQARTEANDGDPIWELYDAKIWRSLLSWKEKYEQAGAQVARLEAALRGWEGRDTDGEEPCSIERGTTRDGNLEVMVDGLTYEQSERIEGWLSAALAAVEKEA